MMEMGTEEPGVEAPSPLWERKRSFLFAFEPSSLLRKERPPNIELSSLSSPSSSSVAAISTPRPPKMPVALRSQQANKLLRTYQLIGITFFAVTGGPFGFEGTVGSAGPVLMLAGLLMFSLLWSSALAIMTTELSCMIPLSGGHVLWIYRAFGPFWSFFNSCLAFTCGVLDNSLYCVLFVRYLSSLLYGDGNQISRTWSILLKLLLISIVTLINIFGVTIVGTAALILAITVMSPFVAMIVLGLPKLNFSWIHGQTPQKVDWGKFIVLLLWNTSGFDGAGTIASEVKNPAKSYPRALIPSVLLILALYGLPTLIGVSVIPNHKEWKGGTYMLAAEIIGGHALKVWMGLSEVLSALGLLLTRLCINSRIVYGMALVDQVPNVFTRSHPRFGSPWTAILATSILTVLLSEFNFYSLAEADMFFYAMSTILKFGALVQLRFTEPDAFRPFWFPVPQKLLAVLTLIPIGFCITMLYFASDRSQVIGLIGVVVAIFGYLFKELFPQIGKHAEEVVQHRLLRFHKNMEEMQQTIDSVITNKDLRGPWGHLGGKRTYQVLSQEHEFDAKSTTNNDEGSSSSNVQEDPPLEGIDMIKNYGHRFKP